MDVGVDEAGDDQASERLDRDVGEFIGEVGMGAAGGDEAILHDQQTVVEMADRFRPRMGRIVGHAQYLAAKRLHSPVLSISSWASVAIAITSGSLPATPGIPIGQVRRAWSMPSLSSRDRKRARLVREPIRPT